MAAESLVPEGEDRTNEQWRALLTRHDPSLLRVRRLLKRVPSSPRRNVCASPFQGLGGAVGRVLWHGPMRQNPFLCKACFGQLSKVPGGAEIEISVVSLGRAVVPV